MDRFGRYPESDQARIYLANGVQIIAPPGKDLLALSADANNCLYGGGSSNVELYLTCLHNAGNIIQSPHGIIWPGAPQYADIPQPPPNYAPSYVPGQPQETAPAEPPASSPAHLTAEEKQELMRIGLKDGVIAAAGCAGRSGYWKCVGRRFGIRFAVDAGEGVLVPAVCSDHDILREFFPHISSEGEEEVISFLPCGSE